MPTTNHASRAPNRNIRAADSRLTLRFFEKTSMNFTFFLPRGRPAGIDSTTATRITARTAAIPIIAPWKPTVAANAASQPARISLSPSARGRRAGHGGKGQCGLRMGRSVVEGKGGVVVVDPGGAGVIKKK